jgi:DNA (cytosine-5)-methyltransferase 1
MRRNTLPLNARVKLLPTPRTTDANGAGSHGDGGIDLRTAIARCNDEMLPEVSFGEYWPAIESWEAVTGIRAPLPTEPNTTNGGSRLNARFSEWMMGLPAGWVTDLVGKRNTATTITRGSALKMIGNGVVPQQAAAAISELMEGWV